MLPSLRGIEPRCEWPLVRVVGIPAGDVERIGALDARPLRPDELGSKGLITKNFFGEIFSSFGPEKTETETFTGEPVRDTLTAPPAGYQTPSPNQPYGVGPKKATGKALTLEQRTAGETR